MNQVFKVIFCLLCFLKFIILYGQAGLTTDGKYIFITEDKTNDYSGSTLVIQSIDGLWKKEIKNGCVAKFTNDNRQIMYKLGNDEYVLELGTENEQKRGMDEKMKESVMLTTDMLQNSLIQNFKLSTESLFATKDGIKSYEVFGDKILFYVQEKTVPKIPTDYMDVWSYSDIKNQDAQLRDASIPRRYAFCYDKETKQLIRLEYENEKLAAHYGFFINEPQVNNKYAIIYSFPGDIFTYQKNSVIVEAYSFAQYNWNRYSDCNIYLVSLEDGKRKLLKANAIPEDGNLPRYWLSPDSKYVVYEEKGAYYSYEIATGIKREIASVDEGLNNVSIYSSSQLYKWIGDDFILIKDAYSDLKKVSLVNRTATVNLTKNFFKNSYDKWKKMLRFDTMQEYGTNIICRISCANRYENDGIYLINTDVVAEPKPLIKMDGPYQYDYFQKAENKDVYLLRRQTAIDPPKYFCTSDFKTFRPVTGDGADQRPAGIATEVLTWKTPDGNTTQGVLYKPRDFDSTKKYPVIFVYYESKNQLHNFYMPYGGSDLVDYGYLVFSPDIYYTLGETGKSALNTVVSAAKFISKKKYVDGKKMGLRGGSFGGYETNYIVTHTNIFSAAISGAGYSDFISNMGSLDIGKRPHSLEGSGGQNRLGVSLWERPDIWIKNSPIFYANRVSTPILIVHTRTDDNVPFEQNVAFFKALRYFGKKAWLLQYDNGGHNIGGGFSKSIIGKYDGNCDMCTRQLQFFNHYLKGEQAAKWMLNGIPARLKGIEKGLELDTKGRTPGSGLRREKLVLTLQQEDLLKHRTMVTDNGRIIDCIDKPQKVNNKFENKIDK